MKEYSIGLDIGTGSVGWVCLDKNYKILKYNNRNALGVHEFEGANSAAARRIQRSTRRRYNRRKKRIQLLQQLFVNYMPIEEPFFSEKNQKHFWSNDNQFENRTLSEVLAMLKINPKNFPTIYHLRNYLIQTNEKEDLRLIYLAIHNLVKFRGNFLYENLQWEQSGNEISFISQLELILSIYAEEIHLEASNIPLKQIEEIERLLNDITKTKSDRVKGIVSLLGKEFEPLFKLLLGLKTDVAKLFPNSNQYEFYKEHKAQLLISSEEFLEQSSILDERESELVELVSALYQKLMLKNILGDATTIAQAKIKAYENFEIQLSNLKLLINKYAKKHYVHLFITSKKNMRSFKIKPLPELLCSFDRYLKYKKNEELFYSELKKIMKDIQPQLEENDRPIFNEIAIAIENGEFLKKQRNTDNAAIPHQNNLFEVEKIIENQQKYYSFMTAEWLEKVKQIISFRIPYYIGPLGSSDFSWMEKKKILNVTPWNFSEVVNKSKSAQNFIERMTNNCTYLPEEKVLPKNALLYEKYELLNELNGIQLRTTNEQPDKKFRLDENLKQWVLTNIFMKYKTVSHDKFLSELKKYPGYQELSMEGKEIYGTQKEDRFVSNLSSHIQFKDFIEKYGEEKVEKIIFMLTIFNEKDILIESIKDELKELTREEIEFISKVSLSGWGRLSKKLLNEIPINNGLTVIEYMNCNSVNFMELMNQTSLKKIIKDMRVKKETKKIEYSDIQSLAGSPALKRGIWRAVKIVEELTSIFGEPTNIILEVAREDDIKKRTKSRKVQFEAIAKEFSSIEDKRFYKDIATYPEDKFKNQRFWLYVLQQGKCLYTQEELDINNLHLYDVDHIFPRSFVVDNSIDNLALVKKEINYNKAEINMPLAIIAAKDRFRMISWWQELNDKKLISAKKLQRLKQDSFTEADKERFISRQLVETRQIISNVRDLLEERFANTKIHLVKASIVSKFRQSLKIPKNRDYNNKHHAVDAFLMTVLINFIVNKYGGNFLEFSFKKDERVSKWSKVAQNSSEFFVFNAFKEIKISSAFNQANVDAMKYIYEIVYQLNWQTTKMTGSSEGMFYKESIFSPKIKTAKYVSDKVSKYVHDEIKNINSYCIKFERVKKNKIITEYKIFDLKVIETYQLKPSELASYLVKRDIKDETLNAEIIFELPKYQKILFNNHPFYYISSSELHNAKQWELPQKMVELLNGDEIKEFSIEEYNRLFNEISSDFFKNYTIYNHDTFKVKVNNYCQNEIVNYDTFITGVNELIKSAAANATRSDKFGSRLSKSVSPEDIYIIYESITGLRYRKPKSLKSFFKNKVYSL